MLKRHDSRFSKESSISNHFEFATATNGINNLAESAENNNSAVNIDLHAKQGANLLSRSFLLDSKLATPSHKFLPEKQVKNSDNNNSKLRRAECNVKDQKTVLKFSTLYVAKFIRRIKEESSLMRFKEMGFSQFNIIKDLSSDYNYFFMRRAFQAESPSLFDRIEHLISSIILILPPVLTFLCIFYIPFKYSFGIEEMGKYNIFFYHLPQFVFGAEIFLNFFTEKGSQSQKKVSFSKITSKEDFCKISFTSDQSASVTYFCRKDLIFLILYIIGVHTNSFMDLIIVLRTYDLFSVLREIDERLQLREKISSIFQLFKLIFFLILFAHFIACSWYKIGVVGIDSGEQITWMTSIQKDNIEDTTYSYYITSLYWAVVTMITLGYGDIVPKNQSERLFVIFITQVSCIIFAYSMNSIGEILKEMGRKKLIFKHQMTLIDNYMRKRGLHQMTQMKVRKYFEYLNKESLEDSEQSGEMIQGLPQTLKEEVYSDVYGRVLSQKKIFSLHFSKEFLKQLSLLMRERRLGPEEVLFKENEKSDQIYIVMKGKVQILLHNGRTLKVLTKGDLVGEISFFSDQLPSLTARTSNVTSLAVLNKEDFMNAISKFPQDYEQYCFMKDNVNLCDNIKGLDHKCVSCGSYTHYLKNCQYVNYVRNEHKILNLYTKNYEQKRNIFYGKRRRKFKSLLNVKRTYDGVVKYIFLASKNEKEQDLQEELSDMASDQDYQEEVDDDAVSPNKDQEGEDDEISRAAISMISSISPQFTKDFFQRTKVQKSLSQQHHKASRFAKQNKKKNKFEGEEEEEESDSNEQNEEDQNEEEGNKNSQEESKNDQFQKDEVVEYENTQNTKVIRISQFKQSTSLLNDDQQEQNSIKEEQNQSNQSNEEIHMKVKRKVSSNIKQKQKKDSGIDKINQGEQISISSELIISQSSQSQSKITQTQNRFDLKKNNQDQSSETLNDENIIQTEQASITNNNTQFATDENLLFLSTTPHSENKQSLYSFSKAPKEGFMNLKKLKDNKLENVKKVRINFETSLIEDDSPVTNLKNSTPQLKYPQEMKTKSRSDALKQFAFDFTQASVKHYNQRSPIIRPRKASESKSNASQGTSINNEFKLSNENSIQVPKIILEENKKDNYYKSNSNDNTSRSNHGDKDKIGGFLSPIAQIKNDGNNSPQNNLPFPIRTTNGRVPFKRNYGHSNTISVINYIKKFKRSNQRNINSIYEEQSDSSRMSQQKEEQLLFPSNSLYQTLKSVNSHPVGSLRSIQIKEKRKSLQDDQSLAGNESPQTEIQTSTPIYCHAHSEQQQFAEELLGDQNQFFLKFDKMKQFLIYFPEFNSFEVIMKYNNRRRKNQGYRMMASRKRIQVKKKLAMFNKLLF